MLRSANELKNYKLAASDGQIGRCKDFLFDDERWAIRYMVADTGGWLTGRQVLISPALLSQPDWSSKSLPVGLRREQIESAPSLEEDRPVSRQHEMEMSQIYAYPYYWEGTGLWGMSATPYLMRAQNQRPLAYMPQTPKGDQHLRSVREVTNYHIEALDGEIGHVEDFILDDETWELRYLVVDTRNWLPGRKVLIGARWGSRVEWPLRKLYVEMTKQKIEESPRFDARTPINRHYESRLYDFYGRPRDWQ